MHSLATSGLVGTLGLLTALAVSAWTLDSGADATSPGPLQGTQCDATFDPDTIEQGDVHEEVDVHLSEPIGEIEEVETPQASDLDVLWVHDDDEEEPQEGRVRLSAVRAEVGEWILIVHGDAGTCEGLITVVESEG